MKPCHGPGSAYKDMKIMKDKDLGVKNRLILHDNIQEFCVTCHNSENTTFVKFDFEESWNKIKHNIPRE